MYISDIDDPAERAVKTALVYLVISLFCVFFGAIYGMFSHGVYSYYMIYAFVFPLAGGTLPYLVLSLSRREVYPGAVAGNLYHSGIVTLTTGSIMCGILDIYGTTNRLLSIYWVVGAVFVSIGTATYVIRSIVRR